MTTSTEGRAMAMGLGGGVGRLGCRSRRLLLHSSNQYNVERSEDRHCVRKAVPQAEGFIDCAVARAHGPAVSISGGSWQRHMLLISPSTFSRE